MRRAIPILFAFGLAATAGCAHSLIPGTEVEDTKDDRAIMRVIQQYRQAVERRDSQAVLDLVSPTYFDERGHPDDPSFHWNYKRLAKELPTKFSKIKDIRLTVTVRRIDVNEDRAKAMYLYVEDYLATLPQGETPEHVSDIDRMELVRSGKGWLITKGL
ncbi:MAG: nuclear transport factor 2 family protein [Deltaproteobacteria bacterium]